MLRSRAVISAALLSLMAGAAQANAAPSSSTKDDSSRKAGEGNQGISETFRSQKLTWEPCFPKPEPGMPPGAERLECAVMKAPLDWKKQKGDTVDLAVSRLRPEKGEPENLLMTNPGGPGEAGLVVPMLFLDPKHAEVADSSEIVGMDVRGTGRSTNVTCGGTSIGHTRDVRDRGRANVGAMLDDAEGMAKACQGASKPLGDFVNTAQTVRDFDLLRAVLGHKKTNWFGFSAGTWLGAQYATAFPSRTDRFVFDSSVEFTSTWQKIYALQPMGFERRFRQDFLPWAARYAGVYGLGGSAEDVRASYERIRARLAEEPLDMGDSVLTATGLDSMIAGSLYNKGSFPRLGELLAGLNAAVGGPSARKERTEDGTAALRKRVEAVRQGAGAPGAAGLAGAPTGSPAGAPDAVDATFYTIGCNDTRWHGNRRTLAATSAAQGKLFPLIGWRSIAEPCIFWDRPAVKLPKPNGRGVPPVLMVQSEHDPATPMEGARRANSRFADSRLLRVTGEGDHMLYGGGNDCVDRAVDSYLAKGELPARGATCEGGPLPEPSAGAGGEQHSALRLSAFSKALPGDGR
ncbi:alpha/beta hydrolase [Streptomyces sp. NPDC048172]|uniref:alpha/beta hydrolase n=1 Tax=Streptomyces sp. NPDC048172 TaxID=3365505 RepID=UPI003719077C